MIRSVRLRVKAADRVLTVLALVIVGCVVVYGADLGSLAVRAVLFWVLMFGLHLGLAVLARRIARAPAAAGATRRIWRGCSRWSMARDGSRRAICPS